MPITTISKGVHKLFASHNEKCPPFTLKFGELFDTVSKDGSTSELFPRVSPPDMFSDYSPCVLSMCVVRVRLPRGVQCPLICLPPAPLHRSRKSLKQNRLLMRHDSEQIRKNICCQNKKSVKTAGFLRTFLYISCYFGDIQLVYVRRFTDSLLFKMTNTYTFG